MLWLILTIGALYAFYRYFIKKCNVWTERHVAQKEPFEVLKSFGRSFLRQTAFSNLLINIYRQFPNKRYSGFYQFTSPTLIVRDPDLIKQLTVKDFDHFVNHRQVVPTNADPIFSRNIISLRDDEWRKMRATLSPSFTSNKLRTMFGLISECSENVVKHFENQKKDVITVEMTDLLTRYTNDVIATTAFGVRCNSLENQDNEFYLKGKKATDFSGIWRNIKFMISFMSPTLARIFRVSIFDKDLGEFFSKLVTKTIKMREEHHVVRPDMIQLLMEARQGKYKHEEQKEQQEEGFATVEEHIKPTEAPQTDLSDLDITAQALIFFFAGFDTVSRSMCFTTYELCVNTDIQDRLREEIEDTLRSCNGKVTYEAILKMKYMDMVVSESLRKWPNAGMTDRQCNKTYTIQAETEDEQPVTLEKGEVFWIPIIGIHRDEQYYPNPEKYDPERFSDENKGNIKPYTYMPFGVGPRNCIGSRFALLEIKILLFNLLLKFELVPVEKTPIPLVLSKYNLSMTAEGGFWMGLKARTSKVNL